MAMNKKYTYIWVSLIILIFGIIVIPTIIERIKGGNIVQSDRMNVSSKTGTLSYVTFEGERRKVPSFELVDQDSLLITDKDYLGKVYVVEFFFTRCPSICPIMTENLVNLQEEFEDKDDFGIASFSITPDYDTPEVLKNYAEKHGIQNLDWHLMTGDKEEIYTLANDASLFLPLKMPMSRAVSNIQDCSHWSINRGISGREPMATVIPSCTIEEQLPRPKVRTT